MTRRAGIGIVTIALLFAAALALVRPGAHPTLVSGTQLTGSGFADLGSSPGTTSRPAPTRHTTHGQLTQRLVVDVGAVRPLYPGRTVRVPVWVTNPYRFKIKVVDAKLDVSWAPGCAKTNLVLGRSRPNLTIAGGRRGSLRLPLGMVVDAADRCQGRHWTVRVSVRAVKR